MRAVVREHVWEYMRDTEPERQGENNRNIETFPFV